MVTEYFTVRVELYFCSNFFWINTSNSMTLIRLGLFKDFSKNVIPKQAGIQNQSKLLDSRLLGSDKLGIIRGTELVNENETPPLRI